MRKNFQSLVLAVIGLIFIAVTLSTFFLRDFQKINIHWVALCFVLVSEIALFLGMIILSNHGTYANKAFVRTGVPVVLALYFVATLITLLIVGAFRDNANNLVIVEIVMLAVALIAILPIIVFSNRVNSAYLNVATGRKLMEVCEKRAYALLSDTTKKNHEKQLNQLYENMRYGEKIGSSSVDESIELHMTKLEKALHTAANPELEINNLFDVLFTYIKQRNMELSASKRGGF